MSYTEIYGVYTNGDVKKIGEVRNAFRGAMSVWEHLEYKYLKTKSSSYTDIKNPLWSLYKRDDLSLSEKIVLLSTYDRAIVYKKDLDMLYDAYDKFEATTSLKEQSDVIKEYLPLDDDVIGVCWNQTSVNTDTWFTDREIIENNEYVGRSPYNINIDGDLFDIFECLRGLNEL